MTKIIIPMMLALFGFSEIALAQDLPTARQRGNVNFVEMVQVKYKTGMSGTAAMHIMKYFVPASKAAGVAEPITLHMQTGEWDAVLFWSNGGSMASFDWPVSEDDEKWWAALAEQNGGAENARKLMSDYQAMVEKSLQNIAHRHLPAEEEDN